jgi:hypothetical protein
MSSRVNRNTNAATRNSYLITQIYKPMTGSKSKILYREEQKHSTPWIFLVIIPVIAIVIFFAKYNEWDGGTMEINQMDDLLGLAILGGILFIMMTGLTILFYSMKLTTNIRTDGISIKYYPFMGKERFYSRVQIKKYEVRKFNPKREYGGHGLKKGRRRSGKSYTVSGRLGLQLYLNNGDKVLIGTRRKEAISYAMEKMMNNEK